MLIKKLEKWLRLCVNLQNIEETELIDIASKKKIADLKDELYQQKAIWNELKEWLSETLNKKQNSPKYYKLNEVLEKMEALEKGDKDVKD